VVADGSTCHFAVFPPNPVSAREARRWASPLLTAWGVSGSDAELAVSELVTNAVIHGSGDITVRLTRLDGRARVEVQDFGPATVAYRERTTSAVGGRGLQIVNAVALDWGTDPATPGPGKTVWAIVPAVVRP
jgi:anti-sigma regulatory factor (Ser/Thr protein kinase)